MCCRIEWQTEARQYRMQRLELSEPRSRHVVYAADRTVYLRPRRSHTRFLLASLLYFEHIRLLVPPSLIGIAPPRANRMSNIGFCQVPLLQRAGK